MGLFQISMISYSIPFKFHNFSLLSNRYFFIISGNVLQTVSIILLSCFILLMADVINRSSVAISLAELMTPWKVSLAVVDAVTSLTSKTISTVWEISRETRSTNWEFIRLVYAFCTVCSMATSLVIVLWIFNLFWHAYQELQYWNFKSTRSRQLSFRFFVTQSWSVLLFFAFVTAVWLLSGHKVFGTENNPLSGLGFNFLLTFYTLLCAYVHLPLREKHFKDYMVHNNDSEDSGFALEVARLMCDISWQVYGVPKGQLISKDSFYIDLHSYSMTLVSVGKCDNYDVQWLIAENENSLVVAFRGSISMINATTNLKIFQTEINNNFWYTGDLRFVNPSQEKLRFCSTSVHSGFLRSYLAVRKNLISEILEAMNKRNKDCVIFFTGHSLGAALATLCCLEIKCRYQFEVQIYTFGSPRVGSRAFAQLFNDLMPKRNSFRMVFESDIVTTYPSELTSYKHIDSEVYIDRAGNLIFMPNTLERSLLPAKSNIIHHTLAVYKCAIDVACFQLGVPGRDNEISTAFDCQNTKLEFKDGI